MIARGLAALAAAMLPRRHWQAMPRLPIERLAAPSGLLTLGAGLVLGAFGFMDYAARASRGIVNVTLDIAARQVRNEIPGEISTTTMQGVSAISPIAFLLFTPLGLSALYLAGTGILRAVATATDDPMGDPILTGLDAVASRCIGRARDARVRRAREHLEGPEVPDRLMTADAADLAGFEYVVIASRRKPGWTAGTSVITGDKWFTLGEPFDVQLPVGLRTVYPLKEQKATEVLRRGVQYELPPLDERARLPAVRTP